MFQNKHIAVVDCAVNEPELTCFNDLVLRRSSAFSYHLPGMFSCSTLRNLNHISGAILLGSSSSVHDNLSWQVELGRMVLDWVETKRVPVLGICFGHQLLAKLFGGSVGFIFEDRRKRTQDRQVQFEKDFGEIAVGEQLTLGLSHREEVKEIPAVFDRLATASDSKFEAMIHKKWPCYSIQSHPEASLEFLQRVSKIDDQKKRTLIKKDGDRFVDQFLNSL